MRLHAYRNLAAVSSTLVLLTLLVGCEASGPLPSDGNNDGGTGSNSDNTNGDGSGQDDAADTHAATVPAPDGQGDVSLPAPGVIPTSSCTGTEPPPPPGQDPDCGDDPGPVRGVFLEGIDGTLESENLTLAALDDVSASAGGCLLATADATSGSAVARMILCDASGRLWDVIGLGTIEGDVVTVTQWEYPEGTALGGLGQTSGGLFYLSSSSDYTISSPGISGTLTATLATSRAIGTEIVFEFDLTASGGDRLVGTFSVILDEQTRVYAAG